jgi:hypothetical protein
MDPGKVEHLLESLPEAFDQDVGIGHGGGVDRDSNEHASS